MIKLGELYPPVVVPVFPPTWDDIERLALTSPVLRNCVTLVRRGDVTREQGLMMAVFSLSDAFQRLFSAEVDRRSREMPSRFYVSREI